MQQDGQNLLSVDIETELKKSFISYAMAVIINRALPDVRDGLKPVHRRILYAMHELSMTPDKPYRKSARIVGDVLGKYHPHGDTAVYDSMVRMAQDFSMRKQLVDGQGNYGSVDGDSAAAMRYTEARMSRIAMEMVRDIDKETVDFYPNFDETTVQPTVLPCGFPNLLVNGSGGIAVGMATNIPPHNLAEVIDGAIHLIDNPDCDVYDLMAFIKGPDFPTGGAIMGMSGVRQAYATGRGRIVVRAKADIEPMDNGRQRIIVSELPYQVNKARLVEKIAELVNDKRLEGISDLRDESDRNGMRVVIELKRDVTPMVVLSQLYKHTQMQDTFGAIMLALVDGEPRVLTLKDMLRYYIAHQQDVVVRRTRYELNKAEERAHILEGLLIALDHIDEVIRVIRSNRDTATARVALMENFGLTERQAQAILDMRLARLTGLERERLELEFKELQETIAHLKAVLANDHMVLNIIREELLIVRQKFGADDPRRTVIEEVDEDIDILDTIEEEDMAVTLTHFGYVKRTASAEYRAQRRGGRGVAGLSAKENDFVEQLFVTSTHTDIMFFTSRGRVFGLPCYRIPEAGRAARGTAIVNLLQIDADEKITAVIPLPKTDDGYFLAMATRHGLIKKTALAEFRNLRKGGLIAISLREGDELMGVSLTTGDAELLLGTRHGMAIRFNEQDARPMGRTAMGVKSVSLGDGDEVVDMAVVDDDCMVLSVSENGFGKRTPIEEYREQSRGGKGVMAMRLNSRTGLLAGQLLVHEDEDIMLIASGGIIIRMPVAGISMQSRATQGVILMRPTDGEKVVTVARLAREDDSEAEDLAEEIAEETAEVIAEDTAEKAEE